MTGRDRETPMIEPRSRGVLDHPLEPAIGLAKGETRWRVTTAECDASPCAYDARQPLSLVQRVPRARTSVVPRIDNAADRSTIEPGNSTGPSQAGIAMTEHLHRQRVLNFLDVYYAGDIEGA